MRKSVLITLLLVLLLSSFVFANTPTAGGGVGIIIDVEDFDPLIWLDHDSRVVRHNPANGGAILIQRIANYAFEGEQIIWRVLVMDKNGIEKIRDVYTTIGASQGPGNDIEANCDMTSDTDVESFNAFIGEERLTTFDPNTMRIYSCAFAVETPASMYGEYFLTSEVEDLDGNLATLDEHEFWYLNPVIALSISGEIDFGTVRPGTLAYSDTLLIENDADSGSGVLLYMTISGSDFYDPEPSGAKCPETNRLRLNTGGSNLILGIDPLTGEILSYNPGDQGTCDSDGSLNVENEVDFICYYATNGGYHTGNDWVRDDDEGYVGIPYETGSKSRRIPIITGATGIDTPRNLVEFGTAQYFGGSAIPPGDEIAITFRLRLPEPCNGDFSEGQIYFWGTAI
ncbi:hypothetical protein ACFLZX_04495 [Nanoarchaeota archaeon]